MTLPREREQDPEGSERARNDVPRGEGDGAANNRARVAIDLTIDRLMLSSSSTAENRGGRRGDALPKKLDDDDDHDHDDEGRSSSESRIAERLSLLETKFERSIRSGFSDRFVENDDDDNNADDPEERRGTNFAGRPTLADGGDAIDDGSAMELPESTFSFLVTEGDAACSQPYLLALATACLSVTCLLVALIYSFTRGSEGNRLGLPVNVNPLVRAAQYLGMLIGVLMEDEIPQGLELMAISARSSFVRNGTSLTKRVIFSSCIRLIIGYLFLLSMFVNVLQTDEVLDVFFDVLALQFIESIDDVAFNLAKRGFYGGAIQAAAQKEQSLQRVERTDDWDRDLAVSKKSWANQVARGVYYFNAFALMAGLLSVHLMQRDGQYRCKTLTATFEEVTLKKAYVEGEPQLLIYSYFNGEYVEDGTFDGYPRYTEGNKNDGSPFKETVGAEFVYCSDLGAWVFRHTDIRTSLKEEKENECNWLAMSPETQDYDLLHVASFEWTVWTGRTEALALAMACNECSDISHCNYHGSCVDQRCICLENHFGDQCQFDYPCDALTSKAADGCGVLPLAQKEGQFKKVYNRPVYIRENLSGTSGSGSSPWNTLAFLLGTDADSDPDGFFNDNSTQMFPERYSMMSNFAFVLQYSGSRWFGSIVSAYALENFKNDLYDYHGFWEKAFVRANALLISEVTYEGNPDRIEFFRLKEEEQDFGHGPYGVLVPLDVEGFGLFSCSSLIDIVCLDGLASAAKDGNE